jgi:hypothetical protein
MNLDHTIENGRFRLLDTVAKSAEDPDPSATYVFLILSAMASSRWCFGPSTSTQGALHHGPRQPPPACYGGSSASPARLGWWPPSPPCCGPPHLQAASSAGGRRSQSSSSSAAARPCWTTSPWRPASPRPPGRASCRAGARATCCTCRTRVSTRWWGCRHRCGCVPRRVLKVHAVSDLGFPGGAPRCT